MIRWLAILLSLGALLGAKAETYVTVNTSIGPMQFELFDKDKPVTVANFLAYIKSGVYKDTFIQRWEPGFVIQAGGFFVTNRTTTKPQVAAVPTFGIIVNEHDAGRMFSHVYGTIAMARVSGQTNSASSQWYVNLKDNSFLDSVDGGFTVFGRLINGNTILNRFIPPPPQAGLYRTETSWGSPAL